MASPPNASHKTDDDELGSSTRPRKVSIPERSTRGTFPPIARVRKRWEFKKIQKEGARAHGEGFTVIARRSLADGGARLGCAISRKVGRAVVRNRIRRLVRETFRKVAASLPPVDLVVIAKEAGAPALAQTGLRAVADDLVPTMERAIDRALDPARGKSNRRGSAAGARGGSTGGR